MHEYNTKVMNCNDNCLGKYFPIMLVNNFFIETDTARALDSQMKSIQMKRVISLY